MLVCYLDDSDAEQSGVVTLAGYVHSLEAWKRFEVHADSVCQTFGVPILHAKEFHGTKDDFKDWSYKRKVAFVDALYEGFSDLLGVSVSVRKGAFRERQKERAHLKSSSPYGTAFLSLLTQIAKDTNHVGLMLEDGLSFVLESGHKNNQEVELYFHQAKNDPFFEGLLRTFHFSGKGESRAIQLADLFAFYSRRQAARLDRYDNPTEKQVRAVHEKMFELITSKCDHLLTRMRDPSAGIGSIEEFEEARRHGPEPRMELDSNRPQDPPDNQPD